MKDISLKLERQKPILRNRRKINIILDLTLSTCTGKEFQNTLTGFFEKIISG